ncbi:MAG: 4-hydroxy-tetrahydrodipicolinate reductase [Tannerellaceae bacterium]|jgi:4-hydroxy-tetrahydrodipicolinate reductase|nr:4-hydroxy-tetrahydrodipicolinate reductase [Tannerellaceae bacterium]
MKIALIGYGKMGRAIETIALQKGHSITAIIDVDNPEEWQSEGFRAADLAVEFSAPQSAVDNYYRCFDAGKALVSGTTGWLSRLEEVKERCLKGNHTMFYASNFSVGVNVLFAVNRYLAELMSRFPAYEARLREVHHIHKKDAPSGTALSLAEGIQAALQGKAPLIESVREGEEPGFHEIVWESAADRICLSHGAKGREGFAAGVVAAAEFTVGRKGFLGMENMLGFSIH